MDWLHCQSDQGSPQRNREGGLALRPQIPWVHQYSEAMNLRLGTQLPFKPGHEKDIELFLDEKVLIQPLSWREPRTIFLCSMTDMFGDFVPDEWVDRIFAVIALTPQHTYQVLTKRPDRMQRYLRGPWPEDGVAARVADATWQLAPTRNLLPDPPSILEVSVGPRLASGEPEFGWRRMLTVKAWPLPNLWLGVSCEDQSTADERIPILLDTPAAVRWVSAEPLIGSIDFIHIRRESSQADSQMPSFGDCTDFYIDALDGSEGVRCSGPEREYWSQPGVNKHLDWIVVGGESGSRARPFNITWARQIVDQCQAADVPAFVKQLGRRPYWDLVNGCGQWPDHVHLTRVNIPEWGHPVDCITLKDKKGGDWTEWASDLRVRQFPQHKGLQYETRR